MARSAEPVDWSAWLSTLRWKEILDLRGDSFVNLHLRNGTRKGSFWKLGQRT